MMLRRRTLVLLSAAASMTIAQLAGGANLYWDSNGASGGAGGATPSGTWGTSPFWNTESDGTSGGGLGSIGNWINGSTVVFAAGADATGSYTVTVAGTQQIGGVTFEDGTVTLAGGNLAMNTPGVTFNTAGVNATISSIISGSGARLTKDGSGTLTLGQVLNQLNTYTAGVTIDGGVVEIQGENNATAGQPNALGIAPSGVVANYVQLANGATLRSYRNSTTSAFVIANRGVLLSAGGGTFDVAVPAASLTYAGVMSGSGRFHKSGAGTLTLVGNNTNDGGVTIDAGKLILTGNNASAGSGSYAINTGATLQFNGEATSNVGDATPTGPIPAATVPDYITLDAGTIASSRTGVGATFIDARKGITVLAAGGTLSVVDATPGNSNVYDGVITGAGGVTKAGPGTLVLSAAQTYQGSTTIARGTLVVPSSNSLGASGASTLAFAGGALRITGDVLSPERDITLASSASAFDGEIDTNGHDATFADIDGAAASFSKVGAGTLSVRHIRATTLDVAAGTIGIADSGGADAGTCVVDAAQIHDSGVLDLRDNKLIAHTTGVGDFDGTHYTGVTGLIAAGYNGGTWDGPAGIVTTMSNAVAPNSLTALGVASADDAGLVGSTFGGQAVVSGDTLVRYTFAGDANLDGAITGDDYFQIDSAFANAVTGWFNGDFNYDGVVNGDDYFLIDSNFPAQGAPLPSVAATPEPSSCYIAALLFAAARPRERKSGTRSQI